MLELLVIGTGCCHGDGCWARCFIVMLDVSCTGFHSLGHLPIWLESQECNQFPTDLHLSALDSSPSAVILSVTSSFPLTGYEPCALAAHFIIYTSALTAYTSDLIHLHLYVFY